MGYCVTIELNVRIAPEHYRSCLAAINNLHTDENLLKLAGGGSHGGDASVRPVRDRLWYSWVNNPQEEGFKSLEEAFDAWRYSTEMDQHDGYLRVTYFQGEKWGNDEILWTAVAPFVARGCYAVMTGEDGEIWRYLFEKGVMREQYGKVIFKDVENSGIGDKRCPAS